MSKIELLMFRPEPEILAEDTPLKAGQSNLKPDGNEDQQLKIEST